MRGAGRVVFAAVLLLIAGTLNIIYGIGAIADANFYTVNGTHYVFGNLHTWGWVTLILGIVQLTAAFSLFGGGAYGRVIGVIAATSRRDRGAAGDRDCPVLVAGRLRDLSVGGLRPDRVRRGGGDTLRSLS